MALQSFGTEAVERVVSDTVNLRAQLTDEQLDAMARHSAVSYWTDGKKLWSIDYRVPGWPISAAEALAEFGLEALKEAREKGTWQPSTPP